MKKIPTEHQEQVALFQWARAMEVQYPELALMFAIPNMGNRHISFAMKMKAEGLKSGVPDICLPVLGQKADELGEDAIIGGLFIELKRLQGGSVSTEQKWWIDKLRRAGYRVEVCKGWVQASEVILDYLHGRE